MRTYKRGARFAPIASSSGPGPVVKPISWREAWSGATILIVVRIRKQLACDVSADVFWQALIVARIDLMNPSGVMASFLSARVLKIATLALSLVASVVVSVHAQAQQPPRPAAREAARPGATQDFLGWLRRFAPTPRGQSRAVPFPPLPRPRPAELTPTPVEPMSAPASLQPDQTQTSPEPAPAPDERNEGPLND